MIHVPLNGIGHAEAVEHQQTQGSGGQQTQTDWYPHQEKDDQDGDRNRRHHALRSCADLFFRRDLASDDFLTADDGQQLDDELTEQQSEADRDHGVRRR